MVKLSVDFNEPKDSSKTDKAAQNGRTPKSLTLEIHHGGWFTPTPSRSYIGGQVSSFNVVDIDVFCLYDLKDMVVKLGYGVEDLINVDTSIFVTPKKGVAIAVDNHLRKAPIEIDSSPDVNRNLTPTCHRILKKEWEQPFSSVETPIIVECAEDSFEELDDILGEYAHIGKQITGNEITGNEITRNESTGNEITGKQMLVHVGNNSIVNDVLELEMLFETEGVGHVRKFKEVEVDADNESEEESDTKGDYTIDSDLEDLDYDPKHDDVFDDDEHIVKEVHVNMNNFIGKEIVKGRVKKHSVETRRQLILVKNNNERVRVRCEGTILALVPYVAIDNNTDKNVFSQTKGGPAIRENINSGKQNILGKDKTVEGKDHVIKSLATNPDIHVRAVQDQMQKQFEVGVSKIKAFRAKRIASDIMTGSPLARSNLTAELGLIANNGDLSIDMLPKKKKKSNDEIASQSASSGKLSKKGKSVSCGKCGNMGHNRKGCRGQGGSSSQADARKVSSQAASATNISGQAAGARKVSSQAVGATNVSGQAAGARKVYGQAAGSRKVSGQAADARKASSQPNAAQSTAKQGPRQGFQGPIAGPASGSQRKTKKLVDL
ncbi:hypothetical protein Tco_0822741 [Tanacetum coccineum]|uniref:PB1-like domain-containing protein n=1 Tax=Tanacetum coccineum TaxID=301880 RepID=A0ABQ5AJ82_9ASTR